MRPATDALIVIDVQNDFCPGGALAVAEGDEIIRRINGLMGEFATVVLTQDWHPANHASFADNHPGAEPFTLIQMPYGPQVLWPTHCVQGSRGAEFHRDLRTDPAHLIVRKGFRPSPDRMRRKSLTPIAPRKCLCRDAIRGARIWLRPDRA